MRKRVFSARKRQMGQGIVEYALILVVVALGSIAVLITVGQSVNNTFNNAQAALSGVNGGGSSGTGVGGQHLPWEPSQL